MSFNDINKMDYVNGGCLFVHIKYFKKIGLFKEDYFLYWEEADWCTRAKEQGLQMTVPINTTCLDKGSTTIGRGKLAYYYYTRNSFYYLDHFNFKRQKYVALIFTIVKILFAFVKGNFNKSIGILLGLTDYIKMKRGINIHV